jgi:hypothetical protein
VRLFPDRSDVTLDSAINKRTFSMVLWRCPVLSGAGQVDPRLLMCVPCFRWLQCSPKFPHLTLSHLYDGFDLNGNRIQKCYVFTLFEIVRHLDCGQGDNCGLYMTMYCHVFNYRFCWCISKLTLNFLAFIRFPKTQKPVDDHTLYTNESYMRS